MPLICRKTSWGQALFGKHLLGLARKRPLRIR